MDLYIAKYWGEYVGGSDDSLTLLDYFQQNTNPDLSLKEILKDLNLTNILNESDWYNKDSFWTRKENQICEFYLPIDVVLDLSAIVVEAIMNGKIDLSLLESGYNRKFKIVCTSNDLDILIDKLDFFADNSAPDYCGLKDMMHEESLKELIFDSRAISSDLKLAKKNIK